MSFARPSVGDLIARIRGDLRGRLEILGPLVRRAMVDVLAPVWGGGVHTIYGYLDWIFRQLFGDTADAAELLRRAAMYGITPVPGAFAAGNVTATGTNGTAILADTILRLDSATAYRVTVGQVVAGGTALLPVVAVLAGSSSNVPVGTALTLESPIAGVDSSTTVAAGGIADGVDQEGIESVRGRYLLRLRKPPEGGADQDYEAWARAVAGVARVWVYRNELGLGTVVVRFVGEDDAGNVIFPDAGAVAAVQAALAAKRPTTAAVTAMAPTELDVAFTIHLVPDNADTRAAVAAELADLLKRAAAPGDITGRGTVLLSAIRTAIGTAAGVTDYTVTVPAANVVPGVGELPSVGDITWI